MFCFSWKDGSSIRHTFPLLSIRAIMRTPHCSKWRKKIRFWSNEMMRQQLNFVCYWIISIFCSLSSTSFCGNNHFRSQVSIFVRLVIILNSTNIANHEQVHFTVFAPYFEKLSSILYGRLCGYHSWFHFDFSSLFHRQSFSLSIFGIFNIANFKDFVDFQKVCRFFFLENQENIQNKKKIILLNRFFLKNIHICFVASGHTSFY